MRDHDEISGDILLRELRAEAAEAGALRARVEALEAGLRTLADEAGTVARLTRYDPRVAFLVVADRGEEIAPDNLDDLKAAKDAAYALLGATAEGRATDA